MNIRIIGDGSFGTFLSGLLPRFGFQLLDSADTVILAVPISAYDYFGQFFCRKHLINVCSVQSPSTEILLGNTSKVTSIHPLFGKRTPEEKRFSILTHKCNCDEEKEFLDLFSRISKISEVMTPLRHDKIMSETHLAAFNVAQLIKPLMKNAENIPDEYIPNSFRLLREFSKTLEDMPAGTVESILANPFNK